MQRTSVLLLAALAYSGAACGTSLPMPGEYVTTAPVAREMGWWQERHGWMAQALPKLTEARLIFLGDSITHQWESDGAEVWTEFYGERNAINLGIGGDRTQHLLWRIQDLDWVEHEPKLAVVLIGTNNAGEDEPRAIADGVIAVLHALRESLPDTPVLLLGLFPRGSGDDDPRRQVCRATNALLAELDDGEQVRYLDLESVLLEPDGTLSQRVMPDLLHLSPEGYRRWAVAIEPEIRRLMR